MNNLKIWSSRWTARLPAVALLALVASQAQAFNWSTNELHYQGGTLDAPQFVGGGDAFTNILTFQHASGWKYGDSFLFVDYLNDNNSDGFNDADFYGELYLNFSLGKMSGQDWSAGPIKDVGVLAGINAADDAQTLKYLPGVRLSWDVPGFAFLNTDFTAYIDSSDGVNRGGAPAEDNSYMIDVNWAYPISAGAHDFSIEGHIEYIGSRDNEFGEPVAGWLLAQPQFRYDLGKTLLNEAQTLFVGIEYQYWMNKLGDPDTDENAVQALVVWRF